MAATVTPPTRTAPTTTAARPAQPIPPACQRRQQPRHFARAARRHTSSAQRITGAAAITTPPPRGSRAGVPATLASRAATLRRIRTACGLSGAASSKGAICNTSNSPMWMPSLASVSPASLPPMGLYSPMLLGLNLSGREKANTRPTCQSSSEHANYLNFPHTTGTVMVASPEYHSYQQDLWHQPCQAYSVSLAKTSSATSHAFFQQSGQV